MVDVEVMYHQVQVPKGKQSSNYALCRIAVENEEGFGEATSRDLNHNFYENDLIKSMEDLYSAKQLLKDVTAVLLRKIAKTRSLN